MLVGVGVGALLAATGCGAGDDGRLSEEEFLDRGNRICADLETDLDAVEEPQSLDELSTQLTESQRIFEDALGELRDLRPPEDLQADYDRLLSTGDDALEAIDRVKQAADEGDVAEVQRIVQEAQQADEESDAIARDLGLDACATD
jgi:hypothetical protein